MLAIRWARMHNHITLTKDAHARSVKLQKLTPHLDEMLAAYSRQLQAARLPAAATMDGAPAD